MKYITNPNMKRKSLLSKLILLFVYLALIFTSSFHLPLSVSANETLYFLNSDHWSQVYVYAYQGGQQPYGGWPGKIMNQEQNNSLWYTTSLATTLPMNFIFSNNSGQQTNGVNLTNMNKPYLTMLDDLSFPSKASAESELGVNNGSTPPSSERVYLNSFTESRHYQLTYLDNPISGTYTLEHYGRHVRIKNMTTNNYLYLNNDSYQLTPFTDNLDLKLLFEYDDSNGLIRLIQNNKLIFATLVTHQETYDKSAAFINNDTASWTIFTNQSGNHSLSFNSNATSDHNIFLNGHLAITNQKRNTPFSLNLSQGHNIIKVNLASQILSLTINNTVGKNFFGATTTYDTYEAEAGTTNGAILPISNAYYSLQSESSNKSAVNLVNTNDYVKFSINKPFNAITVRYSIPDSSNGLGQNHTLSIYVNNQMVKRPTLTSKYAHVYGDWPWSNNPNDGKAHAFYDEVRLKFDQTYSSLSEIKLQKDTGDNALIYTIDLIETYLIDGPILATNNSINLTAYGAIANDGIDDSNALQLAIQTAYSQGKSVYIPEGNFNFNGNFHMTYGNVNLYGAGIWYTNLLNLNIIINGSNVGFYHFSMLGETTSRRDEIDKAAIETSNAGFNNITVSNIYISRYKAGLWFNYSDNVHLVANTIRYTFADGVNLHYGVINSLFEQNDIQSTGDDGIGLWSHGAINEHIKVINNSFRNPWLANTVGVYGGTNITVSHNILKDTVYAGAGINLSTMHNPYVFTGDINIKNNYMDRVGSYNYQQQIGAIWFDTPYGLDNNANTLISDNIILNSQYMGVSAFGGGYIKATIQQNYFENIMTFGFYATSDVRGQLTFTNNDFVNVNNDRYKSLASPSNLIINTYEQLHSYDPDDSPPISGQTLYFYNIDHWDNVYLYIDEAITGPKPGLAMIKEGVIGDDWYYLQVNGSLPMTVELSFNEIIVTTTITNSDHLYLGPRNGLSYQNKTDVCNLFLSERLIDNHIQQTSFITIIKNIFVAFSIVLGLTIVGLIVYSFSNIKHY